MGVGVGEGVAGGEGEAGQLVWMYIGECARECNRKQFHCTHAM